MTFYRFAVVGHPVGHSLSPKMHNFWLRQQSLTGQYVALETSGTQESFTKTVQSAFSQNFCGMNVTVPHKQHAYAICDQHSQSARLTGAVNTLEYDEEGVISGNNTDVIGFIKNLRDHQNFTTALDSETAFILGAGGAMRSVLLALLQEGFKHIIIANRTENKVQDIIDLFQPQFTHAVFDIVPFAEWSNYLGKMPTNSVFVNTTSLGMQGQPELPIISDWPTQMLVTDIVYTPRMTPLLQQAEQAGMAVQDGFGMLLHQGAAAFAQWTGRTPVVDNALRQMILA